MFRIPIAQFVQQVEKVARLLDAVATLAPTRVPVLLLAPRGSSVELLAKALHVCSPREARPFVVVRCGLYPHPTLARELLGQADPGRPHSRKSGGKSVSAIEAASGGTLFIDQVQSTSPDVQLELLRLVTEQQYTNPLDGESHAADVRLIASAWTGLRERAAGGRFRSDLYARLNTVSLELPRGYKDKHVFLDVVDFFRKKGSAETDRVALTHWLHAEGYEWSPEAMSLRGALESAASQTPSGDDAEAVLFAALRRIGHDRVEQLPRRNLQAMASAVERCVETQEYFHGHLYETLNEQLQRTLIQRALLQCNGAVPRAADVLGVAVPILEAKIQELGLS